MEIKQEIIERIKSLPSPRIIAISGLGGSGKSSTAKAIGLAIGAPIISIDSFQKDGIFDTQYSLWEIMDFNKLEIEVLKPFWEKQPVILQNTELKNNGTLIIEGVGLFRPELMKYFTLKIWVDVPLETAIARGKKRDREEYHNPTDECWDGIWKENDAQYLDTFRPKESADIVIQN
jgi:uridine kinase